MIFHPMAVLYGLLTTAVLFCIVTHFNPRFHGWMVNFPGTFGWTEGDLGWQKVWWLGCIGFVWRK